MVLGTFVNFSAIWIKVRQEPSVLVVDAGGDSLDVFFFFLFLSPIISLFFLPLLDDGPID